MAINELIARGGTPDPGSTARGITENMNRIMDFRTKAAQLSEYEQTRGYRQRKRDLEIEQAETTLETGQTNLIQTQEELDEWRKNKPTRKIKNKLEREQAEQSYQFMTEYGDLMQANKAATLEDEIDKINRRKETEKLNDFASAMYDVSTESEFQAAIKDVDPSILKRFKIDPENGLEGNMETVKYVTSRALHTVPQMQALEKLIAKARSSTTGKTTLAKLQRERDIALQEGRTGDVQQIEARIAKEISQADTAWRNVLGPITDMMLQGKKVPDEYKQAVRLMILTKEGPFDIKLMQALKTLDEMWDLVDGDIKAPGEGGGKNQAEEGTDENPIRLWKQ